MAEIVQSTKPLSVNPLKTSQPMGASLAFLGLARTMPLEHGARGCTSFNKLFFMRHFREPIALQTTAMDQIVTVLGADDNVVEALHTIAETNHPEMVGLITTGLSETQGTDIPSTIKAFRTAYPQHEGMSIIAVNATDTLGCLDSGFAQAVQAIIGTLVPEGIVDRLPHQVNVLASPMLTAGDVETIKDWITAFGLTAIVLPDLGDSLDGHLIDEGFSTLTYGGTSRDQISSMAQSAATLVIGPSLFAAADLLQRRTGIADYRFDGVMGVEQCDAFTHALSQISGRTVPARLERQRNQLLDAMVDCHFYLSTIPIAVAADPDLLGMLVPFLVAMGLDVVSAVAAAPAASLASMPVDKVQAGDFEDVEIQARAAGAKVLIANSHGSETAKRLGIPLIPAGFPQYGFVGGHARRWVGYDGTRQIIFDLANMLMQQQHHIEPYRSIYWQGTPRDAELGAMAL